jgi:hypothetical protein
LFVFQNSHIISNHTKVSIPLIKIIIIHCPLTI